MTSPRRRSSPLYFEYLTYTQSLMEVEKYDRSIPLNWRANWYDIVSFSVCPPISTSSLMKLTQSSVVKGSTANLCNSFAPKRQALGNLFLTPATVAVPKRPERLWGGLCRLTSECSYLTSVCMIANQGHPYSSAPFQHMPWCLSYQQTPGIWFSATPW